jgi:orotate phosphoribosyltransferase
LKVLIVEDITTSGGSPGKVVKLARYHGAQVMGVAAISSYGADIAVGADVAYAHVLNEFTYPTYEAGACPQCADHEPIVIDLSLGHGYEFSLEHPDYPGGYVELLK